MGLNSKTGIVTFHNSHNCGSMLQALALQIKLEEYTGTQSTIIDFSSEGQADLYSIFPEVHNIKGLVKNLMFVPYYKKLKKQQADYNKFMANFKMTSEHYSRNSELYALNGKYDFWVCGSDQVWNIRCPDADDAYFLNFVNKGKKIAYAPSFGGVDIAKVTDNVEKYILYFNSFDAISIRETNGKRWLENLINKDVPIIADPTLLLTSDEWREYQLPGRVIKEPYIFYYAFHYSKEQNDLVTEIANILELKVVSMDVKTWIIRGLRRYGVELSPEYGPAAFLNIMANADLILTRSFHGAVFSSLYKKNFWMLGKISTDPNKDDRAYSILKQLGLESREITHESIKAGRNILEPIDYDAVALKQNEMRDTARKYLMDAYGVRKVFGKDERHA